MRILVIDCFGSAGLSAVNHLDPSYELIGGTIERSGRPRAWERRLRSGRLLDLFRYPSPFSDPEGFERTLAGACDRYELDVVLPVASTRLALALSALRQCRGSELRAAFALEEHDKLLQLADKWRTYELCRKLGIPAPRTVLPVGEGRSALSELALPVIVKPRRAEGASGVRIIRTREALDRFADTPPSVPGDFSGEYPYVVQELVRGELHDVCACAQDGRPVSLLTQRRLVTRFDFGGPGIVDQTTHEPEIMAFAERILGHLRWNGPLLVDFVRDASGRFLLLECNPRIWGMVELTIRAGMNICQQAIDTLALGKEVPERLEYPVGMTFKWLAPHVVLSCLRPPRRASLPRLRRILLPCRPGPTVTNLRPENMAHLLGMHLNARRSSSA